MECRSVQQRLSAYMENQLSSQDMARVGDHLKICSKCNRALEDLKRTVTHMQGLEEREPPPLLSQKVMAKVREEAGRKKGILQKLFFPLHIKIPVEVFATTAVIVTALYVFRTIEPDIMQPEIPSEPTIVSEEKEEMSALEQDERTAFEQEPARSPEGVKAKRGMEKPDALADKFESIHEHPPAADERQVPPTSFKSLDMRSQYKAGRTVMEEADFRELRKDKNTLAVSVKDPGVAIDAIQRGVSELRGEITGMEVSEDRYRLTCTLESDNVDELIAMLELLGELKGQKEVVKHLNDKAVITIEVTKSTPANP